MPIPGASVSQCKTHSKPVMECNGSVAPGDEYRGHIRGNCDNIELYNVTETHIQRMICQDLQKPHSKCLIYDLTGKQACFIVEDGEV